MKTSGAASSPTANCPAPMPHRLALAVQYAVAARTLPVKAALRRWLRAALEGNAIVTVRFVGEQESATLNAAFRGKEYPTNVLAFVYDHDPTVIGDLVICAPVLRREAREQGKTLSDHCAHLVVHGMLHLQSYDHDTQRAAQVMEGRETAILAGLGVADPYADGDVAKMDGGRARGDRKPLPPKRPMTTHTS